MKNWLACALGALSLALSLAACAEPQPQPQPYKVSTRYNEADFVAWGPPGPAHVRGQAFVKTIDGEVRTCAGSTVVLFPANALGRELLAADKRGVNTAEGLPADALKYIRKATCDMRGNFTFSELPARQWIVETNVISRIPAGSTVSTVDTQDTVLVREISLKPGNNQVFPTSADER